METPLFETGSLEILKNALSQLNKGFSDLPSLPDESYDFDKIKEVILQAAERLQDNYPYFHPLYAGQMLKPPHPVARLAYMLALWINPNNHALDGGRASSRMEKEAVAHIASIFGWPQHLGHLTSGGTMANLEALWISGQLHPGKTIAASSQAHYTHERISKVLGLPFVSIPVDNKGKINITELEKLLKQGEIGTVVVTLGTTAIGAVDPLDKILDLRKQYHFRIHADCAYGGYFALANNLSTACRSAFAGLASVDSIVIDPHKHGLQPYGCGCVIFRDPEIGKYYKHDSPYTYFSSDELHLGEISLECSRPGAAAVALWTTQQLLPSTRNSEFSHSLEQCRQTALDFFEILQKDTRFTATLAPELDIVVWLPKADSTDGSSRLAQNIFSQAAKLNLHLALAELPVDFFDIPESMKITGPTVRCLRSTLMKAEQSAWLPRIAELLHEATEMAMRTIQGQG